MKKLLLIALGVCLFGCKKNDQNTSPINAANDKSVGASAHDLLSDDNYTSLKITIQYMSGYKPNASAVNNLKSFLQTYLNKPAGISLAEEQVSSGGASAYSLNEVRDLEKKDRTLYNSADAIAVNVLYVDGENTDDKVLGEAYLNTSIVIFDKTIQDNSGALGQVSREKLESAVLEHEFGHLLGLVNIGSPMQTNHEDTDHAHHCDNKNCLMYYAEETTDVLGVLIAGSVPTLDDNCQADLKANGGK